MEEQPGKFSYGGCSVNTKKKIPVQVIRISVGKLLLIQ
jgi:hypothetical protein